MTEVPATVAEDFTRCWVRARSVAMRILGNYHQAEDAAGEALALSLKHAEQLKDQRRYAAWLCRIAENVARNIRRHEGGRGNRRRFYESKARKRTELDAELTLDCSELVDYLMSLVSGKDRAVLIGHYLLGKSCKQLSQELGVVVGTVKRRLYIARERVRRRAAEAER